MDDIQRKLIQLDKQLASIPTHQHIFGTSPLLFAALGLIIGITIQHFYDFPVYFWFLLLIFFSISSIILFIFKGNSSKSRYISAYLALACFLYLGAIRLSNYIQPKADDIRNYVADEPVLATIRGYVSTKPYISKYTDWAFAEFMPSDPGSSFYLKIDEVETIHGWTRTTGKVRVSVDEPVLDLEPGDYIQSYCWLDVFKPPSNPGQFDTADFMAKNGVYINASIRSRTGIKVLHSSSAGTLPFLKRKIKEIAETALIGDLPSDSAGHGLLQALLLGYRGDIDSSTNEAFRKTGLSHYISLSGLHMGILIGIIWWISKIAGLMKPGRSIVCIMAVVIFLLVVPARAPTLRASIITVMFCLSGIFRRQVNSINTLSLAAIVILLFRPTQLFEAGWQLSFSSVLGIILFSKNIDFFIREKADDLLRKKASNEIKRKFNIIHVLMDNALTLFSVGLAAWLASAGILLFHFHTITPLASIWTVLVFPLVSAILILGFLKIVVFFFLPTLSLALGFLVTQLSDLLMLVVKLLARLDISEILIGRVPLEIVVFFYGIIVFSIFMYHSYPALRKKVITSAAIAIIIIPGMLRWQKTHNDSLVMTCLDVGHGQAILLHLPDGHNLLFDAGSMYRSNIGMRIVIPFLRYCGINRVDAVIISHNDIDHINGIPEIVEYCDVGNVYANHDFFSRIDKWGTAGFLTKCLKQRNTEIKKLDEKAVFGDKINIQILWPKNESGYEKELSDNNKSLVALIEFGNSKIILCSDIEQFAQKELLRLYPDLKADIVIIPHHGSTNTLEPGFLESLDADFLICSSDKEPRMKEQMAQNKLYYTSKDGAISASIQKNGEIKIKTNNK